MILAISHPRIYTPNWCSGECRTNACGDARIGEERNVESCAGGKMGPNKREGLLTEDQ